LGQVIEWRRLGCEVKVFCNTQNVGDSILEANQYRVKNFIKYRLSFNKILFQDIKLFNPDVIYFRYDVWSLTLNILMKKYKVIAEINTNDLAEYYLLMKAEKTIKSFLRYLTYYLLRNRVLSNLKGIIAVTKEIMELPSIRKFGIVSTYIPNAIDVYQYKTIKIKTNQKIGLFFIATPNQPWHGVDIIEQLSQKLPEFNFHLVGIEGHSTNNVFFHGYMSKTEYLSILKKCHVCIGTLALYRNNMNEACPLKVREYVAYGFPVILGYNDTAFLKMKTSPDWVLQINTAEEINYNRIKDFVYKMKDFIIDDKDKKFFSTQSIEQKRIHFMRQIITLN
jgi:hypothetical protein